MPMDVDGIPEITPAEFEAIQRKNAAKTVQQIRAHEAARQAEKKARAAEVDPEVIRRRQWMANRKYRDKLNPERYRMVGWYIRESDNAPFPSLVAIQKQHPTITYERVRNAIQRGHPIEGKSYRPATEEETKKLGPLVRPRTTGRVGRPSLDAVEPDKPAEAPSTETKPTYVEVTTDQKTFQSVVQNLPQREPGKVRVVYLEGEAGLISQILRQLMTV